MIPASTNNSRGWLRITIVYLLMVVATIAVFLFIRSAGSALETTAEPARQVAIKTVQARLETLPGNVTGIVTLLPTERMIPFCVKVANPLADTSNV